MILIEKACKQCGNLRKFAYGSPRDVESICGNCWKWKAIDLNNWAL